MAGSAGNWFKAGPGAKGRVFISNKVLAKFVGSDAPRDIAWQKRMLHTNPYREFTAEDYRDLASNSIQPAGQAKAKLPPPPPKKKAAPKPKKAAVVDDGYKGDPRFNPDVKTKSQFATPLDAETRKLIGKALGLDRKATDRDIAGAVGAIDGATIIIRDVIESPEGVFITVIVNHEFYNARRRIERLKDGTQVIKNTTFAALPDAPRGLATRIVARQMAEAAAMGVKRVALDAAGNALDEPDDGGEVYNGYYTWPRLGYNNADPGLLDDFRHMMPANLRDATDLIDLFSRPGGPEFWRYNGVEHRAVFDPAPGSRNRQALDDYLAVKGIDPYAPLP